MRLRLEFQNIVDAPQCAIRVNGQELYRGVVEPCSQFDTIIDTTIVCLEIEHWDKLPEHTIVHDGQIVRDRSFELHKIEIDDLDIQELIWHSRFIAQHGDVYHSCLFFGPNGVFTLEFELPVLRWMLKTRHEKLNNDPDWEDDYNYYTRACQLLQQISTK